MQRVLRREGSIERDLDQYVCSAQRGRRLPEHNTAR